MLDDLIALRHDLHAHPECSGVEHETHDRIAAFLNTHAPGITLVTQLATTGLAAVIAPDSYSRTILYRADTDALPITERSAVPHASTAPGIMHACGHDGHSAIAAGLAIHFSKHPIESTRIIILFQPAEETGQGAYAVLNDPKWNALDLDPGSTIALAIHNLPGYPLGQLVLRDGPMCPASIGLRAVIRGTSGHASQPEQSNSPIPAITALAEPLTTLPTSLDLSGSLTTMTHLHAGIDRNFGVTPSDAVLCATLRAQSSADLDRLLSASLDLIRSTCDKSGLTHKHSTHEHFPAVINDAMLFDAVVSLAIARRFDHSIRDTPMPWSEDFGHFSSTYPGLLIGIGSGESQPHLHADTYDFPDGLIGPAMSTLIEIMSALE